MTTPLTSAASARDASTHSDANACSRAPWAAFRNHSARSRPGALYSHSLDFINVATASPARIKAGWIFRRSSGCQSLLRKNSILTKESEDPASLNLRDCISEAPVEGTRAHRYERSLSISFSLKKLVSRGTWRFIRRTYGYDLMKFSHQSFWSISMAGDDGIGNF